MEKKERLLIFHDKLLKVFLLHSIGLSCCMYCNIQITISDQFKTQTVTISVLKFTILLTSAV